MWQGRFSLVALHRSRKSLAASMLTSGGGSSTKKVPQAPESRQLHRLHQGVFVWTAWPHCGTFASFPKKLTTARQLPSRGNEHARNWLSRYSARLQVVPHFSSGIVERAKCKRVKITPRDKRQHLTGRGKNEGPSFFSLPVGCCLFLRGMIFMRAYVLLALLSLSKNKGLYSLSIFSWPTVRGTQRQFSENICLEDDLKSRIFKPFVVKFLACLPFLGFSNI